MQQINLNGKHYKIVDNSIRERALNPFKGKLGRTGSLEYEDFQGASIEEYFDFRNGIGKKRGVGSDARLSFSEGIDFSIEGQATLGSLVTTAEYDDWEASKAYVLLNFVIPTTPDGQCYECTTAGTSGATEPSWDTTPGNTTADGTVTWTCRDYLAPIKIIDFQDNTYIIQNSRILKWDGTNLDCVDNTLASPIDAIVITDSTDEYLVVSSATAAVYTADGTTWSVLATWKSPDSHTDVDTEWASETNAYDDNTGTKATCEMLAAAGVKWFGYLDLELTNAVPCSAVRYWVGQENSTVDQIDLDAYYDGAWNNVFEGVPTWDAWETKDISGGPFIVEKMRIRFHHNSAGTDGDGYIYEVDFSENPQGYLTEYDNKLFSITTDGKTIIYSTAKDIDAYSGYFQLTGNFGTVYDFFTGKLLADQTPVPYILSNKALFSIDVTNEKAYKQEISYAPLTYAGHAGMYWNANIWVATGAGITKIAPSMATPIGTDQDDGLPSTYQGNVYDMLPVGNWLVFCVNGGTTDKSSIFKRNASLGGNLQVYTTSAVNKPIACMWHSPSSLYTNGRLWFGEDTDVKYMMFPDTTSNVKQISTYEYVNDSGYGEFPIFRKLAAISKTALGVAAITKSCVDVSNEYIEVFYGLNGAAPTTSLGTFLTSPLPTKLTFGSGLGTVFYTIQLAIKLYRGATITNSPELESLLFYYFPTTVIISGWLIDILATGENGNKIFTDFETIRDTNTLVAFYPSGDTAKTSYNIKLVTMPSRSWWENQGQKQGIFQVDLQQVFSG